MGARGEAKESIEALAAGFDAITKKVGVDKQKEIYSAWAAKPGAYPA